MSLSGFKNYRMEGPAASVVTYFVIYMHDAGIAPMP